MRRLEFPVKAQWLKQQLLAPTDGHHPILADEITVPSFHVFLLLRCVSQPSLMPPERGDHLPQCAQRQPPCLMIHDANNSSKSETIPDACIPDESINPVSRESTSRARVRRLERSEHPITALF